MPYDFNGDGVLRWSHDDVEAGRCAPDQLWKPVVSGAPAGQPAGESPAAAPPADVIKADVMAAYKSAGGPAYLQRIALDSPSQFLKLLSRLLPQTVEVEASVNVRQLSAAADRMFEVRRAHGLCQAYPFTTVLPDGKRVVEVGALSPQHLALLAGQADIPSLPGQHFVTFRKEGERWLPVEVRDADFVEVKDGPNPIAA